MKTILTIILVVMLSGCGQFSDVEMQAIVDEGDIVVDAIHAYHANENKYPDALHELIPKYLQALPQLGKNEEFSYMKIPESTADEYRYGFKLAVFDNKGFVVIGAKSANLLIYYPSEKYPQRKFTRVHKRVGRWAYLTSSRTYGKPNTVISE